MDSYFGIIEERYDDRDWLGSDIELKRAPKGTQSFEKNGSITYDQRDIQRNSCSLHACITAYSGLTGYRFSMDDRWEIYNEALNRGFDPSIGWYQSSAVKLIHDFVAGRPDLQSVEYRRFEVGSPSFNKALRLGYMPIIGYRGNRAYNEDRNDDKILQKTEFADSTYGHLLTCDYLPGERYGGFTVTGIVDQYPERGSNFYKIPTNHWKALVKNGVFFKYCYIYIPV